MTRGWPDRPGQFTYQMWVLTAGAKVSPSSPPGPPCPSPSKLDLTNRRESPLLPDLLGADFTRPFKVRYVGLELGKLRKPLPRYKHQALGSTIG